MPIGKDFNMYIYETGLIGEAVRSEIENMKRSVMSGEKSETNFGNTLRSLMETSDRTEKPVGMQHSETASPLARADGNTLLYAIRNADTDETASAVMNSLGFTADNSAVKTEADSLSSSASLLTKLEGAETGTVIKTLTDFVQKYNILIADLRSRATSSALLYANILKTASVTGKDSLSNAGISVGDDGTLSFDADKYASLGIDGFLANIASATSSISMYSSSITGTNGSLMGFLYDEDSDTSNRSDYYNSLMSYLS